ncbi:hypothetical protein KKG36_01555 [Patescibacteria group bacterium]|nr:hypothetical protein [Patescibacteria group bacterium]
MTATKKKVKRPENGGGPEGTSLHVPEAVAARVLEGVDLDHILQIKPPDQEDIRAEREMLENVEEWVCQTLSHLANYRTRRLTRAEEAHQSQLETGMAAVIQRPDTKRSAYFAYLSWHMMSLSFSDHHEAAAMWWRLEDEKLIEECSASDSQLPGGRNDRGEPDSIYHRYFRLWDCLEPSDLRILQEQYKAYRIRVLDAVKQDRQRRWAELGEQVTITLQQAKEGQDGLFGLDIPVRTMEGKSPLQGGRLLLRRESGRLTVKDVVNMVGHGGIGSFEDRVREKIIGEQVSLPADDTMQLKIARNGPSAWLFSQIVVWGLNNV